MVCLGLASVLDANYVVRRSLKGETMKKVHCLTCKKECFKHKADIKRGRGKYCCQRCYWDSKKKVLGELRHSFSEGE